MNENRTEIEKLKSDNLKLEEIITVSEVEYDILEQEKRLVEMKCRELKFINNDLSIQIKSMNKKMEKWHMKIFLWVLVILIANLLLNCGWNLVGNYSKNNMKMLI